MILALGGQTVTGIGGSFAAIFDNGYAGNLGDPVVEGTNPTLAARTSDLANVDKGDTVTVASTSYKVARLEPDGTGMTTVILKRA